MWSAVCPPPQCLAQEEQIHASPSVNTGASLHLPGCPSGPRPCLHIRGIWGALEITPALGSPSEVLMQLGQDATQTSVCFKCAAKAEDLRSRVWTPTWREKLVTLRTGRLKQVIPEGSGGTSSRSHSGKSKDVTQHSTGAAGLGKGIAPD